MVEKRFPVVEIFGPTLQGEGSMAGVKSDFIRFGYCDGAGQGWCNWCDSMFAVDPKNKQEWQFLTAEEIAHAIWQLRYSTWVTLSGGNPALHDLEGLVDILHSRHHLIAVETQGTIFRPWLSRVDHLTLSPKPPSAGSIFTQKMWDTLQKCLSSRRDGDSTSLKVVVDPDRKDDIDFVATMYKSCDEDLCESQGERWFSFDISVVTRPEDTSDDIIERWRRLGEIMIADPFFGAVRVLPQLHVLLWGHGRGV